MRRKCKWTTGKYANPTCSGAEPTAGRNYFFSVLGRIELRQTAVTTDNCVSTANVRYVWLLRIQKTLNPDNFNRSVRSVALRLTMRTEYSGMFFQMHAAHMLSLKFLAGVIQGVIRQAAVHVLRTNTSFNASETGHLHINTLTHSANIPTLHAPVVDWGHYTLLTHPPSSAVHCNPLQANSIWMCTL